MRKLTLLLFCIVLALPLFAQQDSAVVSRLVKEEITRARQKEQERLAPVRSAGMSGEASSRRPAIPEAVFMTIFVGSQVLLAFGFFTYRMKRRNEQTVVVKPRKRTDNSFPINGKVNSQGRRARTMVNCQLQLLRTREELTEQARKLNIGAGELELAWKLQDMSTKS